MNQISSPSKKKLFDTRFSILVTFNGTFLVLLFVLLYQGQNPNKQSDKIKEAYREVASKLQTAGLLNESSKFYDHYFQLENKDTDKMSAMALSIAQLLEDANNLEKALAYYYLVEGLDPESKHSKEANKKIVELLEKMNKHSAAKFALKNSTSFNKNTPQVGGVVIAKIGPENIYLHELNESLDRLPKKLRDQFSSEKNKKEYLKKYISDRLLLKKAKMMNLAEAPEVKKDIDQVTEQILVQKIIEKEIQSKVEVDPADLENYFKANEENYQQKAHVLASVLKIKGKAKALDIVKQLKSGNKFEELVKKYDIDPDNKKSNGALPYPIIIGQKSGEVSAQLSEDLYQKKIGDFTDPILSNGVYHIYHIRDKKESVKIPFEKVKKRVEMDYKMSKAQGLYQKLVEGMIKSEEVELYPEKIQ